MTMNQMLKIARKYNIFRLTISILLLIGVSSIVYSQSTSSNSDDWAEELIATYRNLPSRTLVLVDSLQQLASISSDSSKLYRTRFYKALAFRYQGFYAESLKQQKINYNYFRNIGDSLMTANTADQIGIMNNFMGNMKEAQAYLLEAHRLYQNYGSSEDIAGSNNGLAIFYADMNQIDKAVERYKLSLEQYEKLDDTLGRANVHANLGMLFKNEGKYDDAEYHIGMQGKLDSMLDTQWGLGFYFDFLGSLRKKQGRYQDALQAFEQSLSIRANLESAYNQAESHASLASVYNILGRYDLAIYHSNVISATKEKHQSLSQMTSAYKYLSEAYEGLSDSKMALSYYKEYKTYSDSIYNRDMIEEIAQKDALYQRVEQDHKINILNQQKLASEKLLRQKNRTILIGAVGLALISLLSFFLGRLYKKIKLQSTKLAKALAEKDILLREIHHRVKNNLQLVSSLLNLQSRSIDDKVALEAINDGKARVRSMALIHQDLYNRENLTGISVKDYIEKLIQELSSSFAAKETNINTSLEIEDMELDVDTLVPLGLIINELLTNSFKYAFKSQASGEIVVKLSEINQQLHLVVSDNGEGYDPSTIRSSSFGQKLIKTLSRQMEGELSVSSTEGTTVELLIGKYKRL